MAGIAQGNVYTHDCDTCVPLGTMTPPADYAPDGVTVVDLWVHRYDDSRFSLIYRYADDGPEYESIPYSPNDRAFLQSSVAEHPIFSQILERAVNTPASGLSR